MLAACTLFSDLILVDEQTGEILHTIEGAGWECCLSKCGRWVLCFCLEESSLKLYDTISGAFMRATYGSNKSNGDLRRGCFADDNRRIICAGQHFVEMLDLWSDTVIWHTALSVWYTSTLITSGDGKLLAVEGSTDTVHIMSARDGLILAELAKGLNFRGVTFANSGLELVMVYQAHLRVVCTQTWEDLRCMPLDKRYSEAFVVSPCSKWFVGMNRYNKVCLIDLTTGVLRPLQDQSCHDCKINCLCPLQSVVTFICFTADGKGIVTGHRNGYYKLWDAQTGVMIVEKDLECTVTSVDCSVNTALQDLLLAFAMSQHERLGADSAAAILNTNTVELVLECVM
jgi:WD40 repeat protein